MRGFILLYLLINLRLCSGYDYYEFAVQDWCQGPMPGIHGLWPQDNNGSYPQWCNGTSYLPPTGGLLANMTKYWNSCANNTEFWSHEWEKHGTCTGMEQTVYFGKAVQLYLTLNGTEGRSGIVSCYDLLFNPRPCIK